MELRLSPRTKVLIITTTVASGVRWEWSKKPMNHHGVLLQFYHEGMLIGLGPITLLAWACNPVVSGFITRPIKD
ncbi:hypothetical protein NC653_033435 [Populus alba x Populus x berolinensis]|uniref:Uncharacterized protein n=1 Tax=Populus alba x Populus x berolinensis TaxID=444605 RepID=A0AAD6LWM2_9ROSI|nr:hypothetical protein NC653_033435 [Populus alba x Populus x berolinensis]